MDDNDQSIAQYNLSFYLDQPLQVDLDPSTGELHITSNRVSPAMPGGGSVRMTLSPAATQNFLRGLKALEKALDTPLEQLTKPGSVQ
ncbi:hypothetical protein AWB78_01318 [Caballeronia calidae]|uniref:Uncharacterized protein n=1 Tax=Caballeronia calidae TaxID=1777139 RepID=A0A158A6E1_9BURK|nr:hypothetical protein [Caballeronia calidae]SAK53358.1 hypothetical protein AWB78_01318 [Caballeronia calidae]